MVEEQLDAYLILGCNGRVISRSFIHCSGIENPIVKLAALEEGTYNNVLHFLEHACGLFDSPTNDFNKCVNIVTLLHQKYSIIDDGMLRNIQLFIKNHKGCGLYLYLVLREDFDA